MTQEEFNKLPALLNQADLLALGFKPREIAGYVKSGALTYAQLKPGSRGPGGHGGRRRYRKADVAKLLNFKL